MQSVITGRPIGRPKQFYKYELPQGVIKIVRAQCADYDRKALAIREENIAAETLQSYIKTNEAIDKALDEIEEGCRADFLIDIADNRGYDRSQIQFYMSHNAYYNRKRKAIFEIALYLLLI